MKSLNKQLERILERTNHQLRVKDGEGISKAIVDMGDEISLKFPHLKIEILEMSPLVQGKFLLHGTKRQLIRHYALLVQGKVFDALYPMSMLKEHYLEQAYENPEEIVIATKDYRRTKPQ